MVPVILVKKHDGTRRKAGSHYVILNKVTKNTTGKVSLAVATRSGDSERTRNIRSDRIYFVLKGRMTIKADGKAFIAEPGDALFIPVNTKYEVSGKFVTVTINAPAFDMKNEIKEPS